MKKFFEILGFVFTALLTVIVAFSLLGKHKREGNLAFPSTEGVLRTYKDAPQEKAKRRPELSDYAKRSSEGENINNIEFSKSARSERELPQLPKISKTPGKATAPTSARETGIETPDVADLLQDRSFVKNMMQEWKGLVADAAEQHSLQPAALMAHVLVQSYTDVYSKAQMRKDATRHAGDVVMGADAAARRYEQGATVQQVMRHFRLAQYFPAEVPQPRTAYAGMGAGAKKAAPALTPRTVTNTSSEVSKNQRTGAGRTHQFKEMVAKEYGAKDWKAFESKGDAAAKSKAEKRAKMLSTASVIR